MLAIARIIPAMILKFITSFKRSTPRSTPLSGSGLQQEQPLKELTVQGKKK